MTSAGGEGGGGDVGVMDNTGTVNWRSEKRQAFVSVLNLNSRPLGLILVPQTVCFFFLSVSYRLFSTIFAKLKAI